MYTLTLSYNDLYFIFQALDLGRYSNSSRNGSMPEPVSLKVENSRISSCSDKRNEPLGNKHLSSAPEQLRWFKNIILSLMFSPKICVAFDMFLNKCDYANFFFLSKNHCSALKKKIS